jgi:ribosomal protein L40E
MSETITIIFLFTGLVAIGAVVFAIWLFVSIVKWMIGGTMGLVRATAGGGRLEPASSPTYACPRRSCRATNPSTARFCRRCGQEFLRQQMMRHESRAW